MSSEHTRMTEKPENTQKKKESDVQDNAVTECDTDQLGECLQQVQEWKDKYLRSCADLQNYTKRAEKERMLFEQDVKDRLLNDLLLVVDDFDRALSDPSIHPVDTLDDRGGEGKQEEQEAWIRGFSLIHKQLSKLLEKNGVRQILQLKEFDPQLHEALTQVDSDEHESGRIVEVFQRGFMINDRVLRPAKVSVAK